MIFYRVCQESWPLLTKRSNCIFTLPMQMMVRRCVLRTIQKVFHSQYATAYRKHDFDEGHDPWHTQ
jgi:hypothetical protein